MSFRNFRSNSSEHRTIATILFANSVLLILLGVAKAIYLVNSWDKLSGSYRLVTWISDSDLMILAVVFEVVCGSAWFALRGLRDRALVLLWFASAMALYRVVKYVFLPDQASCNCLAGLTSGTGPSATWTPFLILSWLFATSVFALVTSPGPSHKTVQDSVETKPATPPVEPMV